IVVEIFESVILSMKKIASILLSVLMICTVFTGCSGTNAEMTEENVQATVDAAIEALRNFDTDALDKYVDSSTLSVILTYAENHDQFVELGKAIFANLEFETTEIDLDNATVTLSVKNKDLYQVASAFASDLKETYSTLKLLQKLNDETFLDSKLSALCEDIDEADFDDTPTEITLSITQEKKNLVLSFDETAENAVSGGALTAIKEIYS
ncbi:MAG: hypothetical protein LIO62_05775, partial [Clostridiales bacterium]|nr:hypothetical protein [Clostridiales bacterium]